MHPLQRQTIWVRRLILQFHFGLSLIINLRPNNGWILPRPKLQTICPTLRSKYHRDGPHIMPILTRRTQTIRILPHSYPYNTITTITTTLSAEQVNSRILLLRINRCNQKCKLLTPLTLTNKSSTWEIWRCQYPMSQQCQEQFNRISRCFGHPKIHLPIHHNNHFMVVHNIPRNQTSHKVTIVDIILRFCSSSHNISLRNPPKKEVSVPYHFFSLSLTK